MIVTPEEFLKVACAKGFKLTEFYQTAAVITENPASLDVDKYQGRIPYMIHYTGVDVFSVEQFTKEHREQASQDLNYVIPFFELLKHTAH